MANHGASKSKRKYQQPAAEDRYDSLEVGKKLACYRFWCHIEEERNCTIWNPNQTPSSIWNWRSSQYLQDHIKQSSWSKVAKVSNHLLCTV